MKLTVEQPRELKNKGFDFEAPVLPTGFKSGDRVRIEPAGTSLDLNKLLAPETKNTYLVKVNGESMINENIFDGDILVVDRKEKPADGKIVIASLNGEMAVKKYRVVEGKTYLYSANSKFLPIEISPFWQFEIQGVVKHIIKSV